MTTSRNNQLELLCLQQPVVLKYDTVVSITIAVLWIMIGFRVMIGFTAIVVSVTIAAKLLIQWIMCLCTCFLTNACVSEFHLKYNIDYSCVCNYRCCNELTKKDEEGERRVNKDDCCMSGVGTMKLRSKVTNSDILRINYENEVLLYSGGVGVVVWVGVAAMVVVMVAAARVVMVAVSGGGGGDGSSEGGGGGDGAIVMMVVMEVVMVMAL